MDNSSRNIVKFIAVITFAALLIMGARFYAESQMAPRPSEGATTEAPKQKQTVSAEQAPLDAQNEAGLIIEQDAEIIMGEPSVNLEQGESPSYPLPAQPEVPLPTDPAVTDPLAQ